MTLVAPGLALIAPTVATKPWNLVRFPFHSCDPLRRAGDCIVSKIHRRCTGVVGPANECELKPALAGDRLHDSERLLQCLQNRALLDVKFHVSPEYRFPKQPEEFLAGFNPNSSMALRTEIPRGSLRCRSSSSSLPVSARLPMNGVPKRTPSSSEKPTTSIPNGSRRPSKASSNATASTTPSTPS